MNYKTLICMIICFMTINDHFSQSQPHEVKSPFDPNTLSQRPEQGKFPVLTDAFSVNHFTGQPNIEIPLYTVDAYDIQVPIALKYRTGGLRVDVEDSYLGPNWDLIAGGEIRRTVVGMPDELNENGVRGYRYLNNPISGYPPDDRKHFIDTLLNHNISYTYPFGTDCYFMELSGYGRQYSDGRFDTGPDIYNFNIQGISGTFTTGFAGIVENLQTNEWVRISHHGAVSSADFIFKITDAKGYTYIFGEREWHEHKYRIGYFGDLQEWNKQPIYRFQYAISWKLSEIISPTGESVRFFYDEHNEVDKQMEASLYKTQASYSNDYHPELCRGLKQMAYLATVYQSPLFNTDTPGEEKEKYTYKYLTEIRSTNITVRFYYSFNTSDRIPTKLSSIMVWSGNYVFPVKKFELNNSSNYINKIYPFNNIHSIKEYGHDSVGSESTTFKEYVFSYYPAPDIQRFSVGKKDHWGYYSPEAKEFASGIYNFNTIGVLHSLYPPLKFMEDSKKFGKRDPRTEDANEGMLRQIIYPTGGRVSFDWEFHDYSKRSELLEQSALVQDISSLTDGYFQGHEIASQAILPTRHDIVEEISRNKTLTQINIPQNLQKVTIDLENYYPQPGPGVVSECSEDGRPGITLCDCVDYWKVNGKPNGILAANIPYLKITGPNYSEIIIINRETVWREHIRTFNKGEYKFELINAGKEFLNCDEFNLHIMDPNGIYGKVEISLSYKTNPEEYNQSKKDSTFYAGGVRIKEMIFESAHHRIRKLYNYALDPYRVKSPSSGVLTKAPRYGSMSKRAIHVSCWLGDVFPEEISTHKLIERFTLCPNGLPKYTEASSHIEYARVTEFTTSQQGSVLNNKLDSLGNIRATIYDFCTSADDNASDINETLNIEYVPNNQLILTSKSFNRGHLKQKKEYTHEERTTKYKYDVLEKSENVKFIPATLFAICDYSAFPLPLDNNTICNNPQIERHKDFGIVRYRIIPYNKRIAEIEEIGNLSDNYQKFTYANVAYSDDRFVNSPVSEITVNSEGDTIVNYYTYTDSCRIHTCITTCSGKITAAFRNEYDSFGNLTHKYIAEISPYDNLLAANYQVGSIQIKNDNHPIIALTNKCIETRTYETRTIYEARLGESRQVQKNRLCEITDHNTNVSTVYVWGYNGEFPIAEIKNFTKEQRNTWLGNNINTLFQSENPNLSVINNLRDQLPNSLITTFTYKMNVGMTSVTDPRGVTTYYDYDDFGWLKECYIIENGQKKIVQKTEYRWGELLNNQ